MNKQKTYAGAIRFKNGQDWQQSRPRVELGFKPPQSSKTESRWQPKSPVSYTQKNRHLSDRQEINRRPYIVWHTTININRTRTSD